MGELQLLFLGGGQQGDGDVDSGRPCLAIVVRREGVRVAPSPEPVTWAVHDHIA
jgi:hypothetical protein